MLFNLFNTGLISACPCREGGKERGGKGGKQGRRERDVRERRWEERKEGGREDKKDIKFMAEECRGDRDMMHVTLSMGEQWCEVKF